MKLLSASSKSQYYEDLLTSIDHRFSDEQVEVRPLGEWAQSLPVILDGQPFTFKRHEYLVEPYFSDHPYQVYLKAAQLGLTTLAMLRALYSCRYRNFRGVLYLFPSRSDVLDFSRGRVSPLIAENPETIGAWLKDTDSAGMKQVWNSQLYLRGMVSRVGLKSVPVDFIVFDELDEAPQEMVHHGHGEDGAFRIQRGTVLE